MIRAAPAKPPMPRDYYAALEVGVSATPVQIRQAYQRLARRYSPDVNFLDRDTEALFGEIVEAYRVLSDPTARTLYDRGPVVGEGSERPGRASRPMAGRRGESLHVPVELSFQQAASGIAIDVVVERLSPCRACQATGSRPGAAAVPCGHCGGTGAVWTDRGAIAPETCPACDGTGERVSDPCSECRGRGARPETATSSRRHPGRRGHRRPAACARRGTCRPVRRAARRPDGHHARARGHGLHPKRRQPLHRADGDRGRGRAGGPRAGAHARRHGRGRGAAGNAKRPGAPPAGPGAAAPERRGPGRPLRHRARGHSARNRRPHAGAFPRDRQAPAGGEPRQEAGA